MRIVLPPLNFLTVLPLRALLLFPPSLGSAIVFPNAAFFLILSSKAVPIALYLFAHRCLYCPPVPLPIVLLPLNFAIVSSMPVSFYYYPPAGLSVCALSFRVTPKAVRQCPPEDCSVCILSPGRQVVFVFALPRLLGLLIVSQPARFP